MLQKIKDKIWPPISLDVQLEQAKSLLIKHGSFDYAGLMVSQLKDFVPTYTEVKDKIKLQTYRNECDVLMRNKVLLEIKDELIEETKEYILMQSSVYDANFKRGEVSGIITLINKIKGYASDSEDVSDYEIVDEI